MATTAGATMDMECEYRDDHPKFQEQLRQLEIRADKHDSKVEGIDKSVQALREEFVELRTSVRTIVAVGTTLGAGGGVIIGLLIQALRG